MEIERNINIYIALYSQLNKYGFSWKLFFFGKVMIHQRYLVAHPTYQVGYKPSYFCGL